MCDVGKWRVKVPERGGNVQKWLDSEIVDTITFVDLQVTRARDGTSTSSSVAQARIKPTFRLPVVHG